MDETRRQAADHEAGHYMIARLSPAKFRIHWVTLEQRPGTKSGGSCGTEWLTSLPREWEIRHALAGAIAQGVGLCQRQGYPLTPENLDVLMVGASDDLQGYDHEELRSEIVACTTLIAEHWQQCCAISDALLEQGTLFSGEPDLVLRAVDDDDWLPVLILYRVFRRAIEPPRDWHIGTTAAQPAGLYYEGYHSWLRRDGPLEDEGIPEWKARLLATRSQ